MPSNPMETPEIKPEPHNTAIIEQDQRLSHSMLWELQREFFARQGTLPHYIMGGGKGGRREIARAPAGQAGLAAGPGGTRRGDRL